MLLVTGECDGVITREAGNPGNTWVETTIVVRDWGQTLYVTMGRNFKGDTPAEGERLALNVSVRTYVKKTNGEAGHGYVAHGRNAEAESALFGRLTAA